MKILIITHYYFPHIGGIEIVAENQAKELIKMGHQVTIITSGGKNQKKKEIRDGILVVRVPAAHFLEEKHHVPFPLFSPELISTVQKYVKQSDIVHAHGALYLGSVAGAWSAKLHGKPFFITEHVGFVRYKSSLLNKMQHIAFRTLGYMSLVLSKKVFVLNADIASFVRRYAKKEVMILSNGVDTTLFHPISFAKKTALRKKYAIPTDKPVILFVGRFVQKKGLDLIITSINPSYEYIFVGRGTFPHKIEQHNIHVFTNLSQKNLAEIYQLSDVFLLPSHGEGFPLSMLEAMASGLPIVTSIENKKISILTPSFTRYVKTAKDISNALGKLLGDKVILKNSGIYARNTVSNTLSWEMHAKQLFTVYIQ